MEWVYFPRWRRPSETAAQVVACVRSHHDSFDSKSQTLSSNDVLGHLRDGLTNIGFEVEYGKKAAEKIVMPVLWGRDGVVDKAFHCDAFHRESGVVIEVEAGRAVANNQFLKDLFEACMMQEAKDLVLLVRRDYGGVRDFETVFRFMDTLYTSGRLAIPLSGILVIGY